MSFSFRPAVRVNTPLIIGLAGPTKSGKTYSAHRLAQSLANGKDVAMLNAEGARGHQYADKFKYLACDIEPPYSYARYQEAVEEVAKVNPGVLIIDSVSHSHDGPGGMLASHDAELERMAGNDWKKRERVNLAAWIKPKAAENQFIYSLLSLNFPTILCFRAKEKIKIVKGAEPIDLGWQPICSERIAFETIFTLMLTPGCKGVPNRQFSEMREPFDSLVPFDRPIDEALGKALQQWAAGGASGRAPSAQPAAASAPTLDEALLIKGEEWASLGTAKYQAWWTGLTAAQRKAIGAERHEAWKAIAAKEPQ